MIYRFMADHRTQWAVEKMADVFGVSPSGYYAWLRRGNSDAAQSDDELAARIISIQELHHYRYGSPRVWLELTAEGLRVGHNRIARLMRRRGLNCRPRKKYRVTTNSRHAEPVADNILNRRFDVYEPNRTWVSDITYLPTADGWLYLCVVIDLYNRMIVGWSMRRDMTAAIAVDAFQMAVASRNPEGALLFHTDRGIQYCCREFREASESGVPGLVRSMSRKGNCWDNACAESFFKTLKRELEELDGQTSRETVKLAVFEYIEAYYNRIRIHTHNGSVAPSCVRKRVA